jgi:hypothetical protein
MHHSWRPQEAECAARHPLQSSGRLKQEIDMTFRITGLSPEPFRPLFALSDEELAARGARRVIADSSPGFPDRVSLGDAEPGERLLLVNYTHQPADNPYRASHAIYVSESAREPYDRTGEVPGALRRRLISLRAFDSRDMMIDADVADGRELEAAIARLFENPDVTYLQAHFAKRGCYAARVERG